MSDGPELEPDERAGESVVEPAIGEARLSGESAEPEPDAPTLTRFYSTTAVDLPGSGAGLHIISAPIPPHLSVARHVDLYHEFLKADAVAFALGLSSAETLSQWADNTRRLERGQLIEAVLYTRPDHYPTYCGPLKDEASEREKHEYVLTDMSGFAKFARERDPNLVLFAGRVVYEPLLLVEQSPARAISIAQVVGGAGADIALVTSGVHDPLVLIVAPVAVIIMYAAVGTGEGLRKGLEWRIVRWLTGQAPEDPSSAADEPRSEAQQ